jgi:hypothetical protein
LTLPVPRAILTPVGSMKKQFEQLQASHLYCDRCRRSMPVRQRLLLILPDGELYDYLCQGCGSSVGSKTDRTVTPPSPPGHFSGHRTP